MKLIVASSALAVASALKIDQVHNKGRIGGAPHHGGHKDANATAQCHKQELTNDQNTQYYGEVFIGEQPVNAIFDTGSFELLVMSAMCERCAQKPYDHEKSNGHWHAPRDADGNLIVMEHSFGSGPTVSAKGYDEVSVGPLKVEDQMIWEIMDHNIEALDYSNFHAIVGIGHNFAPESEDKTLLMNFNVDKFSICLERGDGAPGWLIWGDGQHCDHPYAFLLFFFQNHAKAIILNQIQPIW